MKVVYKEFIKKFLKWLPHCLRRKSTVKLTNTRGEVSLSKLTNSISVFHFCFSNIRTLSSLETDIYQAKHLWVKILHYLFPFLRYNNIHKVKWNKTAPCLRCPLSASHIHANRAITLVTKVNNKLALFKIQWQQKAEIQYTHSLITFHVIYSDSLL